MTDKKYGISFQSMKLSALMLLTAAAMGLSACALDTPSQMQREKIEVVQKDHEVIFVTDEIVSDDIATLRDHYIQRGSGPIHLTVTYDPRSRDNTAMMASNNAGQIKSMMEKMGAQRVMSGILPLKDAGSVSKTVISYDIYEARAPKDCELMHGIEGEMTAINKDYKFGCSHDIFLARQIASPQDLLGEAKKDTASARRHSNWIPGYNDGAPNEPLQAESTSE